MADQPNDLKVWDDSSESQIDAVNRWMREQPWYQAILQQAGPDRAASDEVKQAILRAAQAHGVVVDEGNMEIDDTGNFNQKGTDWGKIAKIAGIAVPLALTGAGAFGIGPLSGVFGGAAGGGGLAEGALPSTMAGFAPEAAAEGAGLGAGLGSEAAGAGLAGLTGSGEAGAEGAIGALGGAGDFAGETVPLAGGGGFLGGLKHLFGGKLGEGLLGAGLKGLERAFEPKPKVVTSINTQTRMDPADRAKFESMFNPLFSQATQSLNKTLPTIDPGQLPQFNIPGAPSPVGGGTAVGAGGPTLRSMTSPATQGAPTPADHADMLKQLQALGIKL